MNQHAYSTEGLTKNQSLVMNELSKAGGPLGAYAILDQLRDRGFRAPLQVYRALDKLVEAGLVHKLESLNAFVACRQPGCEGHETTAFMICETCGQTTEISDSALAKRLKKLAGDFEFALRETTIELRGTCHLCSTN
ncbi:MAG: Fur family transcriptional regulator [Rhizobiaceae bacterium]